MIEIKGKRNSAKVYADKIDKETKTQLAALLREEAFSEEKIRVMPDTHSGKGCVVGLTMTLSGRFIPAMMGVDIGCGMEVVMLEESEADLHRLDALIHTAIPCGSGVHDRPAADMDLSGLRCLSEVDVQRAKRSLGTLGGGNHFIELDRDSSGRLILVIHSGSRQLGSDAAAYWQKQAYKYQCKKARRAAPRTNRRTDEQEGGFIPMKGGQSVPKVKMESALLEGELFADYLADLAIIRDFARCNRRTMAEIICSGMGWRIADRFSCVHNAIEEERMLFRKGAISARQGERLIIPLNMRDGAILGIGKGNPDWNFSAPHGAGRVCSRTDARNAYTVEEYQREMDGIYTTTALAGSLDECPMAYKAPERILEQIGEAVEVTEIIRPVYNFKAC